MAQEDAIARNKAASRRVFEDVWAKGDFQAARELFAENVRIMHNRDQLTQTVDETLVLLQRYRDALPDLSVTIETQIAEGNTVANIWTLYGTHTGTPYKGIEATGQKVSQRRIAVHVFNDEGKIVEAFSLHQPLMSEGKSYETAEGFKIDVPTTNR